MIIFSYSRLGLSITLCCKQFVISFEAINLLQKADLNKKLENYKLEKLFKKLQKAIYKKNKIVIKFDDTEIEKCKFQQQESLISIEIK